MKKLVMIQFFQVLFGSKKDFVQPSVRWESIVYIIANDQWRIPYVKDLFSIILND